MNLKWVPWRMGWGENAILANGITLTVAKSTTRGEDFQWSFLGFHSKPIFKTMDEAKIAGCNFAKARLTEALRTLEEK